MSKWFYILIGIFGPVPAFLLMWWIGDYSFILLTKEVFISNYLICVLVLTCARIITGPIKWRRV